MSPKTRLEVNGEAREYEKGGMPGTVAELIASLELDPAMVVAEVNGGIVKRVDFPRHSLADGDRIELVRFVGGG